MSITPPPGSTSLSARRARRGLQALLLVAFLGPLAGVTAPLAAAERPELPEPVASYTLTAELDGQAHRLDGSGTLTWINTSRRSASELYFHLYLNGFRNSASTWLRDAGEETVSTLARGGWGWIEIDGLYTADGQDLGAELEFVAPDDGNREDRSLARVPLAEPVPPGGVLEIGMEWTAQLPRAVARTGFVGDHHLVAQWFPKLAVLEADGRWNAHQFHRSSEFFADFGDYDVTLILPPEYVVGATGRRIGRRLLDDGRRSHRYLQRGVHDFAWTAWPDFVRRRRTFSHPELPEVEITMLLRPDTAERFASRYGEALEHSLRLFGLWYGPYPYDTLTLVDPPHGARATGGMEYPTFITGGTSALNPLAIQRPEGVTVHEFGHQYWYGLLASDEAQESFLDEGINTYSTARVLSAAYGPRAFHLELLGVPLVFEDVLLEHPLDSSARYFEAPATDPIARTSWGYLDRDAYRYMTYSKMSLAMEQLERTLGAETMERAMRAYATRYRFDHPRTVDLEATLSAVAGRDLERFFDQVVWGAETLDMAVTRATTEERTGPVGVFDAGEERRPSMEADPLPGWESTVVVRRLGGVRLPVTVELAFADGERLRRRWDGEARWVRYRITGPKLLWAEVDPDEVQVLDVDRVNNSRRTEPDRRASRSWGQRVLFWIQNVLEVFAALA